VKCQSLNYKNCSFSIGNWCDVDAYLGLRFNIDGGVHLGWARLEVDQNSTTYIVKEFAYNETPGEPINAGQKTLGLEDKFYSNTRIVALNKSIAIYNLPSTTNYKLFSLTGQSVLEGRIENDTDVIEANTLSNGIYIVELTDVNSKAVIRKKIVL